MNAVVSITRLADRINARWQNSVEAILDTGDLLCEAKEQFPAEFWPMVDRDLRFDRSVARKLMLMAQDQRLRAHVHTLPPRWGTIYEITKLADDVFDRMMVDGAINPGMARAGVALANRSERRRADEERVKSLTPVIGKFRSLLLDPSWPWDSFNRTAPDFAPQTMEQIIGMPVGAWADDRCHLWCWTTNRFLWDMPAIVARWGFANPIPITWVKEPGLGLGAGGVRHTTEHLILATRGDLRLRADIASHFVAPRGQHSTKPAAAYELIRRASPGPTGEMGQRRAREGFVPLYVPKAKAA